jgi:acetylornithine/succinyldiaminopimelate/putrescine aminotransferase
MLTLEPGTHGSTFGGNPLGSAIAIRALELIRDEKMVERADQLGRLFREGLKAIDSPVIQSIRGKGLLNAIVIDESRTDGHSAWDLCMVMRDKGLLVRAFPVLFLVTLFLLPSFCWARMLTLRSRPSPLITISFGLPLPW